MSISPGRMPSHDSCCAQLCSNRRDPFDKSLKFHRIPADPDLRREWIARINRADLRVEDVSNSTRLCSEHFYEGCKTKEHPLPIYFAHKTYPVAEKRPSTASDASCPASKKQALSPPGADHASLSSHSSTGDATEADAVDALLLVARQKGDDLVEAIEPSVAPVADHAAENSSDNEPENDEAGVLRVAYARLLAENLLLKRRLESQTRAEMFGVHNVALDQEQFRFYSGLPSYDVFRSLYALLEPRLSELHKPSKSVGSEQSSLSKENELFMVLLWLRTGSQLTDLMYRFNLGSVSVVADILRRWISFLGNRLSPLIVWPNRQRVSDCLPESFRDAEMFSVRGILTSVEYETEGGPHNDSLTSTPSSVADAKNIPLKVLFCITPDGLISFVSQAYPASDIQHRNCCQVRHLRQSTVGRQLHGRQGVFPVKS